MKLRNSRIFIHLAMIAAAAALLAVFAGVIAPAARASELVTLKNGFDLICDHRESAGSRVRLYLSAGNANFVEFGATEIERIEPAPQNTLQTAPQIAPQSVPTATMAAAPLQGSNKRHSVGAAAPADAANASLTSAELHQMLAIAGAQHNLDANLLASIVHAESGGNARAVSRTGAQGLMQLMPGTAAEQGVNDSFRPEENIRGGTAYLNALLAKYRDNLALALAAYNAGPAAVERWRGVPPYRETRAYVARVIREFNARSTPRLEPRTSQRSAGIRVAASVSPANPSGNAPAFRQSQDLQTAP